MKLYKIILTSFFLYLFTFCNNSTEKESIHTGNVFGTYYRIKYKPNKVSYKKIQQGLDSIFKIINVSFSTYLPNSAISKINNGDSTIIVNAHFEKVFRKATEVYTATDGYFDPSVGALVNAYGFGPNKKLNKIEKVQRDSLLKITGWNKIKLTSNKKIKKKYPNIFIDFNALAKGYAIDIIGEYLYSLNIKNYLVEIGGEILAAGKNPNKKNFWKVAIQNPIKQKQNPFIYIISLKNKAIATSGNYRKFRVDPLTGEKYVHSINPLTGVSVRSTILSASVIATDCMTADAWATALMVLPLKKGQEFIAKNNNLEAYWIVSKNNTIKEYFSKGFKK